MSPSSLFTARCTDDQRLHGRMATAELQNSAEGLGIESARFDFDCPLSPTPVEDSIDF
jgi:hypothetical protein